MQNRSIDGAAGSAASPFSAARIAALASLALSSGLGVAFILAAKTEALEVFKSLRYYTLQSNILVAVYAVADLALVMRGRAEGRVWGMIRLALTIAIMVTGIIFALFLSGGFQLSGLTGAGSLLCHYVTPILALLCWLAFADRGHASFRQAPLWLAFPLAYVAYALIQGALTGWYPYWFLNPGPRPEGIGSAGGVAIFVLIVALAFMVIGALLVLVDALMARRGGAGPQA